MPSPKAKSEEPVKVKEKAEAPVQEPVQEKPVEMPQYPASGRR